MLVRLLGPVELWEAVAYVRSRSGEARRHFERTVALCERIGHGRGGVLCGARPLLDLVPAAVRDAGRCTCGGNVLGRTGEMTLAGGDAEAAVARLDESLRILRDPREPPDVAETLRCLADARSARGHAEAADAAREEARKNPSEFGREF